MEDARVLERMASKTMSVVVWKLQSGPSTYRRMPPSLSRNVSAEGRRRLRDWVTVSTSKNHDIAKDTDRLITDSRRDLADPWWDCNEASNPQESPGTRVYGLPVYGDHSRAN